MKFKANKSGSVKSITSFPDPVLKTLKHAIRKPKPLPTTTIPITVSRGLRSIMAPLAKKIEK